MANVNKISTGFCKTNVLFERLIKYQEIMTENKKTRRKM